VLNDFGLCLIGLFLLKSLAKLLPFRSLDMSWEVPDLCNGAQET
jgi:hypothetical protein